MISNTSSILSENRSLRRSSISSRKKTDYTDDSFMMSKFKPITVRSQSFKQPNLEIMSDYFKNIKHIPLERQIEGMGITIDDILSSNTSLNIEDANHFKMNCISNSDFLSLDDWITVGRRSHLINSKNNYVKTARFLPLKIAYDGIQYLNNMMNRHIFVDIFENRNKTADIVIAFNPFVQQYLFGDATRYTAGCISALAEAKGMKTDVSVMYDTFTIEQISRVYCERYNLKIRFSGNNIFLDDKIIGERKMLSKELIKNGSIVVFSDTFETNPFETNCEVLYEPIMFEGRVLLPEGIYGAPFSRVKIQNSRHPFFESITDVFTGKSNAEAVLYSLKVAAEQNEELMAQLDVYTAIQASYHSLSIDNRKLSHELEHRSRNLLQILCSLSNQMSSVELSYSIHAIESANNNYAGDSLDMKRTIVDIFYNIECEMNSKRVSFDVDAENIAHIDNDALVPIGLILNGLFMSSFQSKVSDDVSITVRGFNHPDHYELKYTETTNLNPGCSSLVENLVKQLNGKYSANSTENHIERSITIPYEYNKKKSF